MRIKKIEFKKSIIKLKEPYKIAYEEVDEVINIFLRLETGSGITGFGVSAPDYQVIGETVEGSMEAFKNTVEPALKNCDPLRAVFLLEKVKAKLKEFPSVRAAVDMALYDILGKCSGLPLWKLLGGFRSSIRTSITIGIMDLESTLERAKRYVLSGFRIIKLKGGVNVEQDIEKISKMREIFGDRIALRFDANQGYSIENVNRFVKGTRTAKIELLEQPTPKKDLEQLDKATKMTSIPVMADECLLDMKDAFKLVRRGIADMVNIKLMKCGGITEAMTINSIAKAGGYEAMVGCMDESALGISAGLAFALSRPNVHYADLDGHFDLIDDPFAGTIICKDGALFPSDKPGWVSQMMNCLIEIKINRFYEK